MRSSKLFYSLVVAGLLVFSNVVSAAVYDYGNIRVASRGFTDTNTNYINDDFLNAENFDFTAVSGNQSESGLMRIQDGGAAAVYSMNESSMNGLPGIDSSNQFRRGIHNKLADDDWAKKADKYTMITSPVPEPETYAMILAGLALIGFTARRRNRNLN